MNKQMTPAEIDVPVSGRRPAMSVKEKFIGLDKFDTLLGPNEAEIDSRPNYQRLSY